MHMDDSERCDPKVTGCRVLRLDTQSVAYPAIHMGDVDVAITSPKILETTTQAADDRSPLLRGCIRVQERIWAGRTINKQEGYLPLVLPCKGKPVPPGYPGISSPGPFRLAAGSTGSARPLPSRGCPVWPRRRSHKSW